MQFFDTKGAANRFAEKNYVDNGGKYDRVEAFPRSREYENQNAPPTQLLESLLGKLRLFWFVIIASIRDWNIKD